MLFAIFQASSFLNDLLSDIPNGEYSNLFFSSTLGQSPKSSPVKYSYFSKISLEDNADILAASLLESYRAWFTYILSSRSLSSSVNVIFISRKHFFSILNGHSLVMLYQFWKKYMVLLCILCKSSKNLCYQCLQND